MRYREASLAAATAEGFFPSNHIGIKPPIAAVQLSTGCVGLCAVSPSRPTVESTLKHAKCGQCGRKITKFHCHDEWITLRHLPILGRWVYVRIWPKRYQCPYCSDKPTSTQQLLWHEPNSPNTKAHEEYVLLQLINATIQDVSLKERLGYDAVIGFEQDLTKAQATYQIRAWQKRVETRRLTCFDSFLITLNHYMDEIANYFLDRHTSGFVEGLNNKIKVLKRRCCGILNLDHLFQRLFLDLESYRLFA